MKEWSDLTMSTKRKSTIMVLTMSVSVLCTSMVVPAQRIANETVQKLPEDQILVLADEPEIRVIESNATVYWPGKQTILDSLRLVALRPLGDRVAATDRTKRAILDELQSRIGNRLVDDRIIPFIETYGDLVRGGWKGPIPESGAPQIGIVYFIPFQKGAYHIQIVGELGSFFSVFAKLPQGDRSWVAACKELLPGIEIASMDRNDQRFPKTLVDNYLQAGGIQLKTGERRGRNGPYYGLRLDVEVTKLITNVSPALLTDRFMKGLLGTDADVQPRWADAIVEPGSSVTPWAGNIVGAGLSVVRWNPDAVAGPELSISPQPNFKRRGMYTILISREVQRIVGTVQIGVFPDPSEAMRTFDDYSKQEATPPKEIANGGPGQRSARWWNDNRGACDHILFARDNTVVDLRLFLDQLVDVNDPNNATMKTAKAIDIALAAGKEGVQRANSVKVPHIASVDMPAEATPGAKVEAKVRIVVPRTERGEYSAEKEMEITQALSFLVAPSDPNSLSKPDRTITYELAYITAGCAIASREVILKVRDN